MSFHSVSQFLSVLEDAPAASRPAFEAAGARNSQLTKPPGALGRLEDLAMWYAGWRNDAAPRITSPQVAVFAGNHGVAARGVSAFPAAVTEQMVANFAAGGAAINQICDAVGATLTIKALDLDNPTQDFTQGPALSEPEFLAALSVGWDSVRTDADLFVAGEMGIGNTTSAAAIAYALYGGDAEDWVGRGTGVDDAGLALKRECVQEGLVANPAAQENGLEALRCLGGRELAAMAGAIARARSLSIPVLMDGFICTASAACLETACAGALDHVQAGHQSDEQAHARLLSKLGKEPILSLGLRLGEASGAAAAIGILKTAVTCHSGMATFAEAGVSEG